MAPAGPSPAASTTVLRRMNQRLALDALIKAHTLTASELMEHTGLSRVTAHAVCDDLKDMGWVRELPPSLPASSAGIGRPARTYAFDALAGLVVGIDLGVSTITGQLCDLRGQLLAEAVSTTSRHDRPGAELALDAMTLLNDLLSRRPPESGRILAIALGVPAPVNREGRITQPNIVVPGLQDLDLPTIFRRDDCQVIVENDANLAVLPNVGGGPPKVRTTSSQSCRGNASGPASSPAATCCTATTAKQANSTSSAWCRMSAIPEVPHAWPANSANRPSRNTSEAIPGIQTHPGR